MKLGRLICFQSLYMPSMADRLARLFPRFTFPNWDYNANERTLLHDPPMGSGDSAHREIMWYVNL